MKYFLFIMSLVATLTVNAEVVDVLTETRTNLSFKGVGYNLRSEVDAAVKMIKNQKYLPAFKKLEVLTQKYERLFDQNKLQKSFSSKKEHAEYKQSNSIKDVQIIDWGYIGCLHNKAVLLAGSGYKDEAKKLLNRISVLAPISSISNSETAYILFKSGDVNGALKSYKNALKLSRKYPSQKPYEAVSLRGIGFILIELKEWDEAKKYFHESLVIEPGNSIALNELEYIKQARR